MRDYFLYTELADQRVAGHSIPFKATKPATFRRKANS